MDNNKMHSYKSKKFLIFSGKKSLAQGWIDSNYRKHLKSFFAKADISFSNFFYLQKLNIKIINFQL